MYIIFGSVIVMIIFMFASNIFTMIKTYATTPNPSAKVGNIWFFTLLIINLTVVIFIITFYYNKLSADGDSGPPGIKGRPGGMGEPCMITLPNCKYYAPYTKIQ